MKLIFWGVGVGVGVGVGLMTSRLPASQPVVMTALISMPRRLNGKFKIFPAFIPTMML
jgi:hypothetical protein